MSEGDPQSRALANAEFQRVTGALMRLGLDGPGGWLTDLRYSLELISDQFARSGDAHKMMTQGTMIWPDDEDKGPMTPKRFVRERTRFLTSFAAGLETAAPEARLVGKALLIANVVRELRDRIDSDGLGYWEYLTDDQAVVIGRDGSVTPASQHIGPTIGFLAIGSITLPDDQRFSLLPEHRSILADAPRVLEQLKQPLETAIGKYADEETEDLDEETARRLAGAKRLFARLNAGLALPTTGTERQLPGH